MKQKSFRILVAEGESGEAAAALRQLFPGEQNGLALTLVSGVSTLLASLDLVNPEVILLELSLAHPDPLEAVRVVHRAAPAVPLIVLAGDSEKSLAVRSLRRGALDYLRCMAPKANGGVVTRYRSRPSPRAHAFYRRSCGRIIAEDVTELRAVERRLRQAQKFEAIGQLAGGIAHDFNNLVGAILGWAELGYEQNRENAQVAGRFARIREQAERAAALTRELLTFARRQVLQPRAVDLNTIASSLTSFLDKVIGKDIELKVLTTTVDPIRADPAQLEQVLMNLCLNARDAMPRGGRLVVEAEVAELDDSYCRFYPGVTPGRYAVLSVSDTGIGMDYETRERIFEPFFTTKARGEGTGMGLATVYGIVKQHGGFIHVYSEPEQGSLFRVYLPVLDGPQVADAAARAPVASLAEMRGTETILLADDDEADLLPKIRARGYMIFPATAGRRILREEGAWRRGSIAKWR